MRTIWKVPLKVEDTQVIKLPADATFLTVQVQHGQPCLWAVVDPDHFDREYVIHTRGTGHHDKDNVQSLPYIGTYQLVEGNFVGHVFCADA